MKIEENILYYTEDYLSGKLVNNLELTAEAKKIILSEELSQKLVDILHDNISPTTHRCISVYRDAFVFRGHIYNVCLSCGDFYRDDKHWYLTKEGIEQFKEVKDSVAKKDLKTELITEMKQAIEWYMDNTTVMNPSRSYQETFYNLGMNLIMRAEDILREKE